MVSLTQKTEDTLLMARQLILAHKPQNRLMVDRIAAILWNLHKMDGNHFISNTIKYCSILSVPLNSIIYAINAIIVPYDIQIARVNHNYPQYGKKILTKFHLVFQRPFFLQCLA